MGSQDSTDRVRKSAWGRSLSATLFFDHSHIKIYTLSGLVSGDLSRYPISSPDQWGEVLKDPIVQCPAMPSEMLERDGFLDEFNATMKQAAEAATTWSDAASLSPALNVGPSGRSQRC